MAEHLAPDFRVDTSSEEQRGDGVAQVVETQLGSPVALEERPVALTVGIDRWKTQRTVAPEQGGSSLTGIDAVHDA